MALTHDDAGAPAPPAPPSPPAAQRDPWAVLLFLVEPLAVVGAAWAFTLVCSLPFIPYDFKLEVPLQPASEASTPVSGVELVRQVQDLDLARAVSVERGEDEERSRLVVVGLSDPEQYRAIFEVLVSAGYLTSEFTTSRMPNVDGLLRPGGKLLPILISIQAAIFMLAGLLMMRRRVQPGTSRAGPLKAVLVGVVSGIAAVVLSAVIGALMSAVGFPVEEQEWLKELFPDPAALWAMAPWIVVVGPLAEEVFFRGYAFRFLQQRISMPVGALVSSVMFAAAHLNLSGFLVYLGIGWVLAYAYHRTSNLLTPIVGHVVNNFVALLAATVATHLEI